MIYRYIVQRNIEKYPESIKIFQEKWNLKSHHLKLNKNITLTAIFTNKQNRNQSAQGFNLSKYSKFPDTSKLNILSNQFKNKILPTVTAIPIISSVIKQSTVLPGSIPTQSKVSSDSEELSPTVSNTVTETEQSQYISDSFAEHTVVSGTTSDVLESVSATTIPLKPTTELSPNVSNTVTETEQSQYISDSFAEHTVVSGTTSDVLESVSATTIPLKPTTELSPNVSNTVTETEQSQYISDSFAEHIVVSGTTSDVLESVSATTIPLKPTTVVWDSEELALNISDSISKSTFVSDSIAESSQFVSTSEVLESAATKPLEASLGFGGLYWIIQKCLDYLPSFVKQSTDSAHETILNSSSEIFETLSGCIIQKFLEYFPSLDGNSFICSIIIRLTPKILQFIWNEFCRYRSDKNKNIKP